MKITAITTNLLRLPFPHDGPPLLFAGKPRNGMEMLLLRVDTDEGITGWGEAFGPGIWPATRATIETLIAPLCIGQDATRIEVLHDDILRKLHPLGRSGPVLFALSGLDIALWDIAGKRAGMSIARLLNPQAGAALPGYASLLRYTDPALVARKAAAALLRGYRAVKLHEIGVPQARAAREAIGAGVPLMMDTNCPWTPEEALAVAAQLRDLDLFWLEEPVWPPDDVAGLARVRAAAGMPVAAGENAGSLQDFAQLLNAGAVDYIQPSIIKMGGVTGLRRVFELAGKHAVPVAPHSPYFGAGFIATLHVCAAFGGNAMIERYFCDLDASPFGRAIDPVNGVFRVPDGPGLGVEPDPAVLQRYGDAA